MSDLKPVGEVLPEQTDVKKESKKHKTESMFSVATKFIDSELTLSLPSHTNTKVSELLEGYTPEEVPSESRKEWREVLSKSIEMCTFADSFVSSVNRDDASFTQTLEVNDTKLRASVPALKSTENEVLKGDRGIMRALSQLGLGTLFTVPLYNTGIWVTFKAPTEGYLLDLNRAMVADKVALGRSTYGLAFSSTSSYTYDRILDAALDHISDSTININDISRADLLGLIPVTDLNTLVWGFACTMYPKGVQYERACINNPDSCDYVVKELINLTKLHYVDQTQLTHKQKVFMSDRKPKSKTIDEVKEYQKEFTLNAKRTIEVQADNDSTISFVLKTPSISEYMKKSSQWIDSIVETIESSMTEVSQKDRNAFITIKASASAMRQYSHYIDTIELENANVISDEETIQGLLDVISTDDNLREGFIEKVLKYINETMLTVIAIPAFDCPKCGADNSGGSGTMLSELIPLDVIQLFFTLHSARMRRLRNR